MAEAIPLYPLERMGREELLSEYATAEWNVEQAILYMRDVLNRLQILGEAPLDDVS